MIECIVCLISPFSSLHLLSKFSNHPDAAVAPFYPSDGWTSLGLGVSLLGRPWHRGPLDILHASVCDLCLLQVSCSGCFRSQLSACHPCLLSQKDESFGFPSPGCCLCSVFGPPTQATPGRPISVVTPHGCPSRAPCYKCFSSLSEQLGIQGDPKIEAQSRFLFFSCLFFFFF